MYELFSLCITMQKEAKQAELIFVSLVEEDVVIVRIPQQNFSHQSFGSRVMISRKETSSFFRFIFLVIKFE